VSATDGDGFIYVADRTSAAALQSLADRPLTLSDRKDGLSNGTNEWLVVREAPAAAWERLFTEVKPVPPAQWREVFRKRGRLLERQSAGGSGTP
jgi:hypothetical protein